MNDTPPMLRVDKDSVAHPPAFSRSSEKGRILRKPTPLKKRKYMKINLVG